MRRAVAVALGAGLAVAGTVTACGGSSEGGGDGAAHRCDDPELSVLTASGVDDRPAEVLAGSVVGVNGTGFASGCGDSTGSADPAEGSGEPAPIEGIRLVLVQGSSSREVGLVDAAGADHSFEATVDLPEGLVAGPAQIRAQRAGEAGDDPIATVEVVVGDR